MPMRRFQLALLDQVRRTFPELAEIPEEMLSVPPDPALGDLCLQAFPLAKALRRAPQQIATELAAAANVPGFRFVQQQGPYVNFFLDPVALASAVLGEVADRVLGEGVWSYDRVMRQIPDHFHAHARDPQWWARRFGRS